MPPSGLGPKRAAKRGARGSPRSERKRWSMAEYNLLDKTELSITDIHLEQVNLGEISEAVSKTLGIERQDLLVTDVRGGNLVLDILKRGIDPRNLVGKKDELLGALCALPGVRVTKNTSVSSRGMLSWVAMEPDQLREALSRSEKMGQDIRQRLARRAIVFATGAEVAGGEVMDTNTPAIRDRLSAEGYTVKFGGTLKDDELLISANLREAADGGYGLVITTGGVGAEDKDRTVEALLLLDPEAATPSIVKYQLGVGRHKHKDRVRIAVGQFFDTVLVALPGPTDEVEPGIDALARGLRSHSGKAALAEQIAKVLRKRLRDKIDGNGASSRPGHGSEHGPDRKGK